MNDTPTTTNTADTAAPPVGTQLITLDPATYVTAVFATYREQLDQAKAAAVAVAIDVSTPAGMKVAVTHRAALRTIRVEAEKARQLRKKPILEIGRLLDSRYKEIEAEIEPLEDRFDAAIKAEEKRRDDERAAREHAERERVARIKAAINDIRTMLIDVAGRSSAAIEAKIKELVAVEITAESAQEFLEEAEAARGQTLARLREMHAAQLRAEEQAAQIKAEREALEREKAEQAERERVAQERADAQAKLAAEAEAERLRAIRAEEAAARERIEAQEREARARREAADREIQVERERIATAARELEERQRREREAEEEKARAARAEQEEREREERITCEASERQEQRAAEQREREEREKAEAEQRQRDEAERVERLVMEERQAAEFRALQDIADADAMLTAFKTRFGESPRYAPVVKAIDAYFNPKPARAKRVAAA